MFVNDITGAETPILSNLASLVVAKFIAFLLKLVAFALPSDLHAPFVNKLDDRREFVGVKPYAVTFADIDNDAGCSGEIIAVHQFAAIGTGRRT